MPWSLRWAGRVAFSGGEQVRTSKDLYRLLGLPRGASREDVRKAHRRLVRKYHPDANSGDNSTEERFKEVQHAYEVLSDPRKRWEYDDEVLLRGSSRSEALSNLVLSNLVRHVNSWKAGVSVLALILIMDGFLFYRYEQPENSVFEPRITASTLQSIATSAEVGAGRRAETQAKENDTHSDAIHHEQQDSSSYLRGTEPVATEGLSPYPLSSTASANYPTPVMDPTPVIAEAGLAILPTSALAADYYYSPDSLYEYSYYLPEPLYEEEVRYE
jgi:curved DNA-binding protein CbpA